MLSTIELDIIYSLSAVNGLSRLTTKFSNRPMTFESNRNGRFKLNLEASQVTTLKAHILGAVNIVLVTKA